MAAIDRVLERLDAPHETADSWMARCPAHEDRKPSLSIREGEDGRALLKCHAGCTTEAIVEALGIDMAALFPDQPKRSRQRIAATYDYTDEEGNLLFQVVRYEPKTFKQRRPDGRGGWTWGLSGVRRVPYRLPALLAMEGSVFVVEGERDVEALERLDLASDLIPPSRA